MKQVIFFLALMYSFTLRAQDREERREVAVIAGLNSNDAWEIGASFTYYLCNYIGATIEINALKLYSGNSYGGKVSGNRHLVWAIQPEEANIAKFLLCPAIRLRSPSLWLDKDRCVGLTLNMEPGLYLEMPVNDRIVVDYKQKEYPYLVMESKTVLGKNTNWVFWNMRSFINLKIDYISVSAGYMVSNFDIYNGRRYASIEETELNKLLPSRKLMHSGFVAVGYHF